MRFFVSLLSVFALMLAITGPLAFADPSLDVTPCQCALQGMQLSGAPWFVETLGNGLEDFMFDLNGDGLSDLELLVPKGDQNRIPLFYWVNDQAGKALYTIEDSLRDGTCSGMTVIWHKYMPNWKGGA